MPVRISPSRWAWLLLGVSLAGCGDDSICGELQGFACEDCPYELARCEFDGVVVTEPSCDTCNARRTLYEELCDRGSEATPEEVEAGIHCEVVEDTAVCSRGAGCAMTGPVVGISEHNGWAELVTVGRVVGAPALLDRRRVELVAPGLPQNPYHHEGLELPLAEAAALVARVRTSVAERCRAALDGLRSTFGVTTIVVQHSPYERLPDALGDVLASWALTCAADGMMYREGLVEAAGALGLAVVRVPRKSDRFAEAARALGVDREEVIARVERLGERVGPPWRREHREAAAAALGVLDAA